MEDGERARGRAGRRGTAEEAFEDRQKGERGPEGDGAGEWKGGEGRGEGEERRLEGERVGDEETGGEGRKKCRKKGEERKGKGRGGGGGGGGGRGRARARGRGKGVRSGGRRGGRQREHSRGRTWTTATGVWTGNSRPSDAAAGSLASQRARTPSREPEAKTSSCSGWQTTDLTLPLC